MIGYGGKELADAFRTVRGNTLKIAEDIPEDKYDFRAAPEVRSVARLLTHIALATRLPLEIHQTQRLTSLASLDFFSWFQRLSAEEQLPRSKGEILQLLRTEGDRFAAFL